MFFWLILWLPDSRHVCMCVWYFDKAKFKQAIMEGEDRVLVRLTVVIDSEWLTFQWIWHQLRWFVLGDIYSSTCKHLACLHLNWCSWSTSNNKFSLACENKEFISSCSSKLLDWTQVDKKLIHSVYLTLKGFIEKVDFQSEVKNIVNSASGDASLQFCLALKDKISP